MYVYIYIYVAIHQPICACSVVHNVGGVKCGSLSIVMCSILKIVL